MSSAKYLFLLLLLLLTACGDINDDLLPSGSDQRPLLQSGTTGWGVGQIAPPFMINDISETAVDLDSALAGKKAIVFYFTMWCPICDSHMSHAVNYTIPAYPDVSFFAVDYLAASTAAAKEAAANAGYLNSGFTILADLSGQLARDYGNATMGTTIVIDSSKVILMNEDYRNGVNLQTVLSGLP